MFLLSVFVTDLQHFSAFLKQVGSPLSISECDLKSLCSERIKGDLMLDVA